MRIYLLRHGKTLANLEHRLAGQSHAALSEGSFDVCRQLGQELSDIHFDAFFSSPQQRCRDTYAALQLPRAPAPIFDDRLKEINVGIYEGKKLTELPESFMRELLSDGVNTKPPGGEAYAQVQTRVEAFLCEIQQRHPSGTLGILSHWGPSAIIAARLLGLNDKIWSRWEHPNERVYKIENQACAYLSPGQPWQQGYTLRQGTGFGPFTFKASEAK